MLRGRNYVRKHFTAGEPDETLRDVADRMSQMQLGVLPVIERDSSGSLTGLITQFDLLSARDKLLQEERHRERVLRPRLLPRLRRAPDEDPGLSEAEED